MSRFCLMCQQREALAMPSTTILKLSGYTKTDCAIPVIGKGGFAVGRTEISRMSGPRTSAQHALV